MLLKVISHILTCLSKYLFIEESKKMKGKRRKRSKNKEILTFTIMNIKIMIEKSFTYACVLSNKCRNRPAIIAKRLAAVLDAAS